MRLISAVQAGNASLLMVGMRGAHTAAVDREMVPLSLQQFRRYDLNLLLTLLALLEERSVTAAAHRLGLTQSAASRALGRLRRQLDDPILVRSGGGMVPTSRAAAMEGPLREILHDLGELLMIREDVDPAALDREFVIQADDYPLAALAPGAIDHLRRSAPRLRVRMHPRSVADSDLLAAAELDLLLTEGKVDAPGTVWELLVEDRVVVIARADHPRINRTLTLDDLLAEDHIATEPRTEAGGSLIDAALEMAGARRRVAIQVPSVLLAARMTAHSDLISCVPERSVQSTDAEHALQVLPFPIQLPKLAVYLGYHERLERDPEHRWFRDAMAAALAVQLPRSPSREPSVHARKGLPARPQDARDPRPRS